MLAKLCENVHKDSGHLCVKNFLFQLRLFLHQKCHFGAGGIGSCLISALITLR